MICCCVLVFSYLCLWISEWNSLQRVLIRIPFFVVIRLYFLLHANQFYQQIIAHRRREIISTEWLALPRYEEWRMNNVKILLKYRFSFQHHILFWVNALSTGPFYGRWNVYFRRKNSARGRKERMTMSRSMKNKYLD